MSSGTYLQVETIKETAMTEAGCNVKWPAGVDVERAMRMLDRLHGLPVTEPEHVVPGGVCSLCHRDRHRFVHPHRIPGSLWWVLDGCACCETHVGPGDWPGEPVLGRGETPREVDWADSFHLSQRPDGRYEVDDSARGNAAFGCQRDGWCILRDGHEGECNEQREVNRG